MHNFLRTVAVFRFGCGFRVRFRRFRPVIDVCVDASKGILRNRVGILAGKNAKNPLRAAEIKLICAYFALQS